MSFNKKLFGHRQGKRFYDGLLQEYSGERVGKGCITVPLENAMSLGTILLIVLVLILLGVIPSWPHSKGWGYGPSGGLGLVLLVVVVLLLTGRI